MAVSVFELFKIGIGPSSSHTVGPMKAAYTFVSELDKKGELKNITRIKTDLFGSLGATGRGHGSDKAILMGLEGEQPDQINPTEIPSRLSLIRDKKTIQLNKKYPIAFNETKDLIMHMDEA